MDIIVAVIPALITGVITVLGVVLNNSKTQGIINERIEQLRKEVEKHNKVVERTYKLENDVNIVTDKCADINERLTYLEHHELK